MFRIFAILCVLATCWAQDCTVSNFNVMKNFDKERSTGTWYAVAKKDQKEPFLLDNIVAHMGLETNGSMSCIATGRVMHHDWEFCANMFVAFEDSPHPAKFKIKYSGTISFLQNKSEDFWIIDTDYDNYAVHYSCLQLDTDGTCLDSYSYIYSRNRTGLRSEDEQIVMQKMQEICLFGKYSPVPHNEDCVD